MVQSVLAPSVEEKKVSVPNYGGSWQSFELVDLEEFVYMNMYSLVGIDSLFLLNLL